jgi:hypothetical protein
MTQSGRHPPVRRALRQAVTEVLRDHPDLLRRGIAERTITGHIARQLAPAFPTWAVDPEYNRRTVVREGYEETIPKRVGRDRAIIVPDIVVHRRGSPQNLLAVELKRASDARGTHRDRRKLKRLRKMGYVHAVLVILQDNREPYLATYEWM